MWDLYNPSNLQEKWREGESNKVDGKLFERDQHLKTYNQVTQVEKPYSWSAVHQSIKINKSENKNISRMQVGV